MASNFENWGQFLIFKMSAKANDAFTFRLRNSFPITVERTMLGPFRDCFFDEKYLRHLPDAIQSMREPTIVDIGANVGYFSLYALYKYPKARIFSFEPLPFCFNQLQKYQNEYKNPSFTVYNYAVGKIDGPINFYVNSADSFSTDSSIQPTAGKTILKVQSHKLETLKEMLNIGRINLLKLDCEGAEYDILYALTPKDFQNIDYITMEVHNVDKERDNVFKMVDFLKENQYQVFHEDIVKNPLGGHVWAALKK